MIKLIGGEPHGGESGADGKPLAGSNRLKPPAGGAGWFWVLIAVISVAAGTALAACPAFLAAPLGADERRPAGDGVEEITISIPVPRGKEILAVSVYAAQKTIQRSIKGSCGSLRACDRYREDRVGAKL